MTAGGLALVRRAGLEPLGLVYGVVNRVSASGGVSVIGEQRRSVQAHLDALRTALARMSEQARALGAGGVAGVAIELRTQDAAGSEFMRLLDCRAGGTAVRDAAAPADAPLWTATLTAAEIWQMRQAGYRPSTVVTGFGAVFATGDRWAARRQMRGETARTLGRNVELSWMAEALQQARRMALAGVEVEAQQTGASGVVGLRLEQRLQRSGTGGLLVEIQAIGTAIASPDAVPAPAQPARSSGGGLPPAGAAAPALPRAALAIDVAAPPALEPRTATPSRPPPGHPANPRPAGQP